MIKPLSALALCLILITGCQYQTHYLSPSLARETLREINANFAKIEQPVLFSDSDVSVTFPGKLPYSGQAALAFDPPRSLRFEIRHALAGKVAEVGSNDEFYWVFVEPEIQTLWWGTWDALEQGLNRPVSIPPDQLLAALALQPLPKRLSSGIAPLLIEEISPVGDKSRSLLYLRGDDEGWPFAARKIRVSTTKPMLPIEIQDFDDDGKLVMNAKLSRYEPIAETGADGPKTPHRYEVSWPQPDGKTATLTLTVGQVEYYSHDIDYGFPDGWQGNREPLDLIVPDDPDGDASES